MDRTIFNVVVVTLTLTSIFWLMIMTGAVIGVTVASDKKRTNELRAVFERGLLLQVTRTSPPASQCVMGDNELRCFATKSGKAYITSISAKELK